MKIIFGIDPGVTTGICVYNDQTFYIGMIAKSIYEIINLISSWSPNIVVMENFIIGPRPSIAVPVIKIIGAIEFYCGDNQIPIHLQSPSVLKLMLPRVAGIYPSPHVRSACAHVMYYLLKNKEICS